jgi:hypothetical protein
MPSDARMQREGHVYSSAPASAGPDPSARGAGANSTKARSPGMRLASLLSRVCEWDQGAIMGEIAKSMRSVRRELKTEGGEPLEPLKEAAVKAAKEARDLVSAQLTQRASKSGHDLGRLAKGLQHMSEQLEGNMASPYVHKLGTQLERTSQLIEEANPRDLVKQVESFAKREPLWFIGGALAVGVLGARFIKSALPA